MSAPDKNTDDEAPSLQTPLIMDPWLPWNWWQRQFDIFANLFRPPQPEAPIGLLELDGALLILNSNREADRLLNKSVGVDSSLLLLFPDDRTRALLQDAAKTGEAFDVTVELPEPGAGGALPVPLRIMGQRLRNQTGWTAAVIQLPLGCLNRVAVARDLIQQICKREQDPRKLLKEVLDVIRPLVPFHIATYYVHADGLPQSPDRPRFAVGLRRARRAFKAGDDSFKWPMRWAWITKSLAEKLREEPAIITDSGVWLESLNPEERAEVEAQPSTQASFGEHLRSFLYFPLREGERTVSALSFASQQPGAFGRREWEVLREIGLEVALEFVALAYDRRSKNFSKAVARLFAAHEAPQVIAEKFVKRVAEEFPWDYVGIFRAARTVGTFQLIAQEYNDQEGREGGQQHAKGDKRRIPDDYEQAIDKGVLAWTLTNAKPARIENVDRDGHLYGYMPIDPTFKSCLCYPVAVGPPGGDECGRSIEWIIDCESKEEHAFEQPDIDALTTMLDNLRTTLELWFETQLSSALLERIGEGVVVTDEEGRIQRLNLAARTLLGLVVDEPVVGSHLRNFAADDEARELFTSFAEKQPIRSRRVRMRASADPEGKAPSKDGPFRGEPVALVTASLSSGAFNRWIWQLTDVSQKEWIIDLHYLRGFATEVAQQTRGSLWNAKALISSVKQRLQGGELADQLVEASKSLMKADLTYERLAKLLSDRDGLAVRETLDVPALLKSVRDQLPDHESRSIKVTAADHLAPAIGNEDAVATVLRSILGSLLSLRSPATIVECMVWEENSRVVTRLTAQVARSLPEPDQARDAVERWEAFGRRDAGLAFDQMEQLLRTVGGKLEAHAAGLEVGFTATLPSAEPQVRQA